MQGLKDLFWESCSALACPDSTSYRRFHGRRERSFPQLSLAGRSCGTLHQSRVHRVSSLGPIAYFPWLARPNIFIKNSKLIESLDREGDMTYQLVLVLLSNVVEVDIGDGVVASVCKMKEEVFGAIKVNPILSIRVVIWQSIRLQHLCFQLFLL